ncbi:hypothetical protein [Vreelandella subglaciescola]|jgi:hypothetical protein|uniref:Uncharacterized protein n=1 Tax=Vreelandella subglaciescola TaxID=29571 RepID=A0A1M7FKW6_9GAMM|nr:hypothetical protein [Halomonas subglaciescola]SHM04646.1 hypothetical protein SAMN05878437_0947 [Halomonas subglaciescola]
MKQKTLRASGFHKARTGAQGRNGGHMPGQSKKHLAKQRKAQEGKRT